MYNPKLNKVNGKVEPFAENFRLTPVTENLLKTTKKTLSTRLRIVNKQLNSFSLKKSRGGGGGYLIVEVILNVPLI